MDNKEVAEVLSYFHANVSDLKVLGKEWGLSDDDISTCIENAMAADIGQIAPASNKTHTKFAARRVWLRMRWRCTFFIMQLSGVFAVLLVAGAIAMKNDEVHRRVLQIIDPLLYPLLWSTRLITLPIHDIINAYDYYMEECLVDNPLFNGGQNSPEMCEMCQNLKTVNVFQSSFSGNLTEVDLTNAHVFQGKGEVVSLENLQQVLSSSPVSRRLVPGIKTNLAWPTQVVHLIDERLQGVLAQSPFFYFLWVSKQPSTSQLMRKLFPNPSIFGQNANTPLKKSVFLEGPKSRVNPLSANLQWPISWYMQGWGSRKAVLTPISSCLDTCQRLDIILQKGDLLTYSSHLYKVDMHPVGDNISISFLSYFDTV